MTGPIVLMFSFQTLLLAAPAGTSANFIPGEVILKFMPGTGGSEAVIRAGKAAPAQLDELAPVTERLQATADIPLKAKRVSGGNWVTLSIDVGKVRDRVVERLRARGNIADVRVRQERAERPLRFSAPAPIAVTFTPSSPESKAVAQKLAGSKGTLFAKLISELEQDLGTPLKADVTQEAEVLLQVDLKALTLILTERLKALSEIESAQPNYVLAGF